MAGVLYNAIFFFFFVEKFCFFIIKPGLGPCEPPAQKNIEFCQILKANVKKKSYEVLQNLLKSLIFEN